MPVHPMVKAVDVTNDTEKIVHLSYGYNHDRIADRRKVLSRSDTRPPVIRMKLGA